MTDQDRRKNNDYWTPDGMTYVLCGNGYCVSPHGATVCVGPVDEAGKQRKDTSRKDTRTPSARVEQGDKAVTRPPVGVTVGGNGVTDRIMKLAGQGKSTRTIEKVLAADGTIISYRTIARRLQGVLC